MSCVPSLTGRCFRSQLCLPNAEGGRPSAVSPATRGRRWPPLPERLSQPGGVSLPLALSSRPRWFERGRRQCCCGPRRGPGRGAVNGGGGEAERRPRSALNPQYFRSPTTFPSEVLPLWGRTEGEGARREVLGEAREPERLEPAAEAVAESAPASPPRPRLFPVFSLRPPRRSRSRAARGLFGGGAEPSRAASCDLRAPAPTAA